MKATKIKIKNLFGITETELDGRSVEITGTNGTGKTSVIDSIRYALTAQLQPTNLTIVSRRSFATTRITEKRINLRVINNLFSHTKMC